MSGQRIVKAAQDLERLVDWGLTSDDGSVDLTGKKVLSVEATVSRSGLPGTILPAIPGRVYRIVGIFVQFVGSFNTLTDFRISTTEGTPKDILLIELAQAGDGTVHTESVGTHTLDNFLTDLAAGTSVQLRYTGDAPSAGTSVKVRLFYRVTA